MKKLMALLEYMQIMAIFYLIIEVVFVFDLNLAVLVFVCFVNTVIIAFMRMAQERIEKGNLELYKGFARRLGWMDIVSDLNDMKIK